MKHDEKRKLFSHATIIAVFTVLSKLLGLLRDRFLASEFGASATLDSYYAAFRIPDFIFNLIVLGTVSAAFVPVFLSYVSKKQEEQAFKIANGVLNAIVIVIGLLALVGIVFARPLVYIIAPGFDDPEIIDLTVSYMRWMMLSPLIFGISSVLSGILNAYRRFVAYSLAPVLYNLGIIVGIIAIVPFVGPIGLAWGVVLGAMLHLIVQVPSVAKVGYRWKSVLEWKDKGFRRVVSLMVPRMFGYAALQVSLLITIAIATTLEEGSTTVYNLALNLQFFPVTIFGVSIATAVFPLLASAASTQDLNLFRESFSLTFRKIMFFIIPTSIIFLLLRAHIVRIVLGTGAFDWEDTVLTLDTLGLFSLSLFAQALLPLVTRAFFSLQDTKTPVTVGIISMVINIALSFALAPVLGVAGLALAFAIASILNAVALTLILRWRIGNIDDLNLMLSTLKIVFASLLMGFTTYGLLFALAPILNTRTYVGLTAQAVLAVIGGAVIYLLVLLLTRSEEVRSYVGGVKKFLKRIS